MKKRTWLWVALSIASLPIIGFIAVVGYFVSLVLYHPPAPQDPAPRTDVRVPFEYVDGSVYVTASLNGKPVRALLDTGGPYTVIDTDYAKRMGIASIPSDANLNGQHQEKAIPFSYDLRVGGQKITTLAVSKLHAPMILGMEGLLNNRVVEFNFQKREMVLHRRKTFVPPTGAKEVALTVKSSPSGSLPASYYLTPISVGGAPPIPGLIDLGSSGYLSLSSTGAKTVGLKPVPGVKGTSGGVNVEYEVGVAAADINLAGYVFPRAPMDIAAQDAKYHYTHSDVIIGARTLAFFHSWMDLSGKRMWLIRPPRYEIGVGFQPGKDEVAGIKPGSPADKAGLKTGDRILTVNGQPAKAFWATRDASLPAPLDLVMSDGRRVNIQPVDIFAEVKEPVPPSR